MAAPNAAAAATNLYAALTPANFPGAARPPLYFGEAPQLSGVTQVRPPYVVLVDLTGFDPEYQSNHGGHEAGTLRAECYANTLADAALIAKCVKWNGLDPEDRAGFDWGTLAIDFPLYHLHLRRTREQSEYAGLDKDGNRVHKVTLTYECKVGLSPGA